MATNKILLKKSSVAGKQPATGDIDYGEVALNFNDGRLYFRDSNDQIQFFEKASGGLEQNFDALLNDLDLGSVADNNLTNQLDLGSVTGSIEGTYDLGFVVTAGIIAPDIFVLPSFEVASLPDGQIGQVIYVSNDVGGPTLAFFDGSDWRRTSDNQVVVTS